jgi:autotransporter translocation and assembly factor TamB
VIAIALGGLLALLCVAILGASVVLQGPRLASLIEGALPQQRGKLTLGGVSWSLRALVDIVTDAPSPVSVDGLRITDPEGTVVLDVPHADARIKLRTLVAKGSFSIHELVVGKAMWRFAQMQQTPEIGFLAALAPKGPAAPVARKDGAPPPGGFFRIVGGELGDLNAIFDFPGAWGLELRHARVTASLDQSTVDPRHPQFGFDVGPLVAEGGGWLRILDDNRVPFDRVVINRVATTSERPDDIFLDLREARTGRSVLVGKGFFTGIYGATSVPGIDLHADWRAPADAFNQVVRGKHLDGLAFGGEDGSAVLALEGPFAKLGVKADFAGLDVTYDTYRALGLRFGLRFDGAALAVQVKDLSLQAPGGGRLDLGARLDLGTLDLSADLRLAQLTTDSYLPVPLQPMLGGTVSGRTHVEAQLGPGGPGLALRGLDLRLDRRRAVGLPRSVRAHGSLSWSPAVARTSGLTVEIAGAEATARGDVKLARQVIELGLDVVASDLARALSGFGISLPGGPPHAAPATARLDAAITGTFASPKVLGTAVVTGLGLGQRRVPELRARLGFDRGTATLVSLSGELLGGRLDGRGSVRLFDTTMKHPLRSPELDATLHLKDIDLEALAGSPALAGRLSLDARLGGTLADPAVSLDLPGDQPLVVASQQLRLGPVRVTLAEHVLTVHELRLVSAAGARLSITGTAAEAGPLDLRIEVAGVRLGDLPGASDPSLALLGTLDAELEVRGTLASPLVSGTLHAVDVSARGIALGEATIVLSPDPAPAVTLPGSSAAAERTGARGRARPATGGFELGGIAVLATGELFHRFHLEARLGQRASRSTSTSGSGSAAGGGGAGFYLHGAVSFDKLVLESLLPELAALGDGQGLASGRVQVDLEPGRPLAADVNLTELWASLSRAEGTGDSGPEEAGERRVEISATAPIHVTVAGSEVVVDDIRLATTGGALHAKGRLDGRTLAGTVDGHLDLELLQPFARGRVEHLAGDLDLSVTAAGTLDLPQLGGRLNVRAPIHFRPVGFDTDVIVTSGTITLSPERAELSHLRVSVDGPVMEVDGQVQLGAGFRPERVDAHVAGEISARLLADFAGGAVSDAKGRARIRADVKGPLAAPVVSAWLGLGSITFRLRDTGNDIEVQSGVIELDNSGALLRDVRVVIDGQGKLVIGAGGVRPGRVELLSVVPLRPGRLDFPLHGEQLVYRSPGAFELDDLAFDLDLQGDLEAGFGLGGEVRIISGRYTQDFVIGNLVLRPRTNESGLHPFYDGKPLLADLRLNLTVKTVGDAFVVQDNIAPEIHVDVALHVGGTLSQPRLAGDVRPTDGRFQIPVLRGYFDLVPNVNHITFVETKSVADGETPEIYVEAQNSVVDASGIEHVVRMNIHGPLREMQIDLSTADGLDRSQTALLLLTGRTTTNSSDRLGTQNPTVGANLNTGIDIAGQATRDAIANLMEPIIGDTFERAVGVQLRLTVGPDGFEGRLRKQINRVFWVQADTLFGFQGQSRWQLQGETWIIDYLSLVGGLQRQTLVLQPGLNESQPINTSLELRWDFPIRR